jgi:hypothetical protein
LALVRAVDEVAVVPFVDEVTGVSGTVAGMNEVVSG